MSTILDSMQVNLKTEIAKPMLLKFYEAYLREENDYGPERYAITNFLKDCQVKQGDIDKIDEMITVAEDKSCEAAFNAGFKSALAFFMEVLL